MSIIVNGTNVSLIHVRHDGRSHGINSDDIDVNESATQAELFGAIETHLDLEVGSLSGYELDITAETENAVIRPQAKFGAAEEEK